MEEILLCTQINLVKKFQCQSALNKILIKMQPLIKKYAKKLFFMEKEDAIQELSIAIIEAIYHIKEYDNEFMCLTYLEKSVLHKYFYLCKKSQKFSQISNQFGEIPKDIPYYENYKIVEISIDIQRLVKNEKQKLIIKYMMNEELSDSEISSKMGISRQYINRVRKKVFTKVLG